MKRQSSSPRHSGLFRRKPIPGRNRLSCPNPDCSDFGRTGGRNIKANGTYAVQGERRRNFCCKTCRKVFSETFDTVFYGLKTPRKQVLRTISHLVEAGSIRGLERTEGFHRDTITDWLHRAAKKAEEVDRVPAHHLHLSQVQLDEFWTFVKKRTAVPPEENTLVFPA